MASFKQVLVVREDLGMSRGKMIAQACHACLGAYRRTGTETRERWIDAGAKKVALKASEERFAEVLEKADIEEVTAYLVKDAGRTELEPGTKTAIGVGPAEEERVDRITGDLELVR